MPRPVTHCRWVTGSLSVYDGTPPIRLHVQGTKGMQAVGPAEDEWMPASLRARLTPDNRVDARLRICPIPGQPPRGLREVCIDEARDVHVVQP